VSFKNIFNGGGNEAKAAGESAREVRGRIPGARPEREGVDPELYEDIPEVDRDPKIMRETSPEALDIMNGFLAPMFENTRTAAAEQRATSENPASTSGMASSAKDEAFTKVDAEVRDEDKPNIGDEDRPRISDEERERLRKDNDKAAQGIKRTGDGPAAE
jgi:hypothetical protein